MSRAAQIAVVLAIIAGALGATGACRAADALGVDDPLHGYHTRAPADRFARLQAELALGTRRLDTSGDVPFLRSVLAALEVPVESQLLVFTATSLQKALISPRRPRALYFSDDTYVGWVPGGRVEIVSLDPALGSNFYIFDRLRLGAAAPRSERADDCMNCHAPHYLDSVPALVVESVVPGFSGGGERAFRREQSGHAVPLGERFGGWHVTGAGAAFPRHWGNLVLERSPAGLAEIAAPPGKFFDLAAYPVATSDALAHLLHEHQVGWVNRATQAAYRVRSEAHAAGSAGLPPERLDALARPLVRYLLFADEAPLPSGALNPDPAFRTAFLASRKADRHGRSLRDLDAGTRLLRHRGSYMIYSPAFAGLPEPLKARVLAGLDAALTDLGPAPEGAHLPPTERAAIRAILCDTLPEAAGWSR